MQTKNVVEELAEMDLEKVTGGKNTDPQNGNSKSKSNSHTLGGTRTKSQFQEALRGM
jgi:hypothetical protein